MSEEIFQATHLCRATPKSVAIITMTAPCDQIKVQRTVHEQIPTDELEPGQGFSDRFGYRRSRIHLKNGSSIMFFNLVGPQALYGCLFDLVVYDDQIHPGVLAEAKKRLISNLSSVEGEPNV